MTISQFIEKMTTLSQFVKATAPNFGHFLTKLNVCGLLIVSVLGFGLITLITVFHVLHIFMLQNYLPRTSNRRVISAKLGLDICIMITATKNQLKEYISSNPRSKLEASTETIQTLF